MKPTPPLALHLPGEPDLVFPTAAGNVAFRATDDLLTPYGGLVPWAAFVRHLGIFEHLDQTCPVTRTSPNASPIADILHSFALTALTDGRHFSHVMRLREDPGISELFGLSRGVVSDDTIRRFFESVPEDLGGEWVRQASARLWDALPERLILDWDSSVVPKYGHQEGAEIGYNPAKPGRRSFHPLFAIAAGTRLCPGYQFRAGDTVTAADWAQSMEQTQANLGPRRVWLNRGDIGLGHEAVMAWHETRADAPRHLFKLKQTANVRRAISGIVEEAWQGPGTDGAWQVAEIRVSLAGWSRVRRVVVARRIQGQLPKDPQAVFWKENRHEFAAYVTNLEAQEMNAWQVQACYRERADAENVFDELKNQWGFSGFCARSRRVSALASRLLLLVYNLWTLFCRLLEPSRHVEASGGRRWFLVFGARLVRSGRRLSVQVSVKGPWWEALRAGYERLARWLSSTAPQLDRWRRAAHQATAITPEIMNPNCGI